MNYTEKKWGWLYLKSISYLSLDALKVDYFLLRFSVSNERHQFFLYILKGHIYISIYRHKTETFICTFSAIINYQSFIKEATKMFYFSFFFESLVRSHYFMEKNFYIFNEQDVSAHKYFIRENKIICNWNEYETYYFPIDNMMVHWWQRTIINHYWICACFNTDDWTKPYISCIWIERIFLFLAHYIYGKNNKSR